MKGATEGRYYLYFQWRGENPNAETFFRMFGIDFRKVVKEDMKASPKLREAVDAFLEIGNMRNTLVHEQLLATGLDRNADDYYELHKKALIFIDYLRTKLV